MKVTRKENSHRGAAMVEAALTMLTLLVLMFAIFESGRVMNIQQTLTNAAREGARFSVLPAAASGSPLAYYDDLPSVSAVQARVQEYLNAAGLNGATATVGVLQCCDPTFNACANQAPSPTLPTCPAGQFHYSRVTVTVPYNVLTISMFGVLQMNMQGQATMRNETNFQ